MEVFQASLLIATFLCSLVAGFLFAFAIVVMPGISILSNKEFVQAFQVMDRIIQNNQPVFMVVWVGSVVALVASSILGIWPLHGAERWFIPVITVIYIVGVQLPTMVVNIPLNNVLQTLDVESAHEAVVEQSREDFESHWVRSNAIRAAFSSLVSVFLIISVFLIG